MRRVAFLLGIVAGCGDAGGGIVMVDAADFQDAPVDGPASWDAEADAVPSCSDPSYVCVRGTVRSFVDPTVLAAPSTTSTLYVKLYDPPCLIINAGQSPLAILPIQPDGTFESPPVHRPYRVPLITILVAQMNWSPDYQPTGVMAPLVPGQDVDATAYYIEGSTLDAWQAQVGGNLQPAPLWIGEYLDSSGTQHVANVQPSRDTRLDPRSVICFGADRLTLTTAATTSSTGLCAVVAHYDYFESYSGTCGVGGCRCGNNACAPTFPSLTGGAALGTIFIQTLVAQ